MIISWLYKNVKLTGKEHSKRCCLKLHSDFEIANN